MQSPTAGKVNHLSPPDASQERQCQVNLIGLGCGGLEVAGGARGACDRGCVGLSWRKLIKRLRGSYFGRGNPTAERRATLVVEPTTERRATLSAKWMVGAYDVERGGVQVRVAGEQACFL